MVPNGYGTRMILATAPRLGAPSPLQEFPARRERATTSGKGHNRNRVYSNREHSRPEAIVKCSSQGPLAKLGHEGGVCPMPLRGPQS